MEILKVGDLSFAYPGTDVPVLQEVSFSLEEGSFALLMGDSGSGKSTLLRLLKRELAPRGEKSGEITLFGREQAALTDREAASLVGFVAQRPDEQIVTDRVWHEAAFTGESLGMEQTLLRRRVGEIASYFAMGEWFRMETDLLSGGQKQLLTLASVLVAEPKLLLLDEPTSRLDPVAEGEFLSLLTRLNREMGVTILLATHDPSPVADLADTLFYLEKGRLLSQGTPREVWASFPKEKWQALPQGAQLWHGLDSRSPCPLNVREGRQMLQNCTYRAIPETERPVGEPVLEARELSFRFAREGRPLCDKLSMTLHAGEFLSVVGGNGSGKTTLLRLLCGFLKPVDGKILLEGKPLSKHEELWYQGLACLPQEPASLFGEETVGEELRAYCKRRSIPWEEASDLAEQLGVTHLLERHPLDLSGGELQLCALCRVLLQKPKVLLLDEPTKGLDAFAKERLGWLLRGLTQQGTAILTVTHDLSYAARWGDTCALLFDGGLTSPQSTHAFFAQNRFYTTPVSRMTGGACVTVEEVWNTICRKEV